MSVLVYGDPISRIRFKLKAINQDSFLTSRDIWSLYKPWINQVMKELDAKNRLMAFNSLFETMDIVPLEEVDTVEAKCVGIQTGHTLMRTKDPVGELFMEAYWGGMVRSITSIDSSQELQPISLTGYKNIIADKNAKYNKTLYYWIQNDHYYFPNITWKAVRMEVIPEEDISKYKCDSDEKCKPRLEQSFNIPDYILARAESLLMQSLGVTLQLPGDQQNDNKNTLK